MGEVDEVVEVTTTTTTTTTNLVAVQLHFALHHQHVQKQIPIAVCCHQLAHTFPCSSQ